jgi:hypothetical protein
MGFYGNDFANFKPKMQKILNFVTFFVIRNLTKLQKLILEGEII